MDFIALPIEILEFIAAAIPSHDPSILNFALCSKGTLEVARPLLKIQRWANVRIDDAMVSTSTLTNTGTDDGCVKRKKTPSFRHPLQVMQEIKQDSHIAELVQRVTIGTRTKETTANTAVLHPDLVAAWPGIKPQGQAAVADMVSDTTFGLPITESTRRERDKWRSLFLSADAADVEARANYFALLLQLLPNLTSLAIDDQHDPDVAHAADSKFATAIHLYLIKFGPYPASLLRRRPPPPAPLPESTPVAPSPASPTDPGLITLEWANAYNLDRITMYLMLPTIRCLHFYNASPSPPRTSTDAKYPLTVGFEFADSGPLTVKCTNCGPSFFDELLAFTTDIKYLEVGVDRHYPHRGPLDLSALSEAFTASCDVRAVLDGCLESLREKLETRTFEIARGPLPGTVTSNVRLRDGYRSFHAVREEVPERQCLIM